MLSSPVFRQGITELACKQGKNSDEVKEFSEGYACISCFRAVSRYVMQISACEQAFCVTARGSVWRRQLKQCVTLTLSNSSKCNNEQLHDNILLPLWITHTFTHTHTYTHTHTQLRLHTYCAYTQPFPPSSADAVSGCDSLYPYQAQELVLSPHVKRPTK